MAVGRSSHIRGKRVSRRLWLLGSALGCSLAAAAPASAAEAAAADACPHRDLAPNPWFVCAGLPAEPARADGADGVVVTDPDGAVTIDGAGHLVGVYTEGAAGHVSVRPTGVVDVYAADQSALGVGMVGLSGFERAAQAIDMPMAPGAEVWLQPSVDAVGDSRGVVVFAAGGAVRLSQETAGDAAVGVASVTAADGAAAHDVYVGAVDQADWAVRLLTVNDAESVGVELVPGALGIELPAWGDADALPPVLYRDNGGLDGHLPGALRGREAAEPQPLSGKAPGDMQSNAAVDQLAGSADTSSRPGQTADLAPRAGAHQQSAQALAVAALSDEAYGALKVAAVAQELWLKSADAWATRMRDLRDVRGGELRARGQGVQAWIQAFGGAETLQGDDDPVVGRRDLQTDWRGVQLGFDHLRGDDTRVVWWGLTVGLADYDGEVSTAGGFELTAFNLGGYAGAVWGGLYAEALVKADVFQVEASFDGTAARSKFDGVTWGAQGEVGFRFGTAKRFLEPSAGLAWTTSDLDAAVGPTGTARYGDAGSLRGRAGLRMGGQASVAQAIFIPYVGLYAVEEFDGENRMSFASGATTIQAVDGGRGGWGEFEIGASALTRMGLEAFAAATALFGGEDSGYSARLGVRWRW